MNFVIPYTTPANYTFNSDKIEVDSGLAKLKKLTSDDETFYASYNTDINGSRGDGILTGTPIGGASVSGGKLDLAHNDLRYVDYDAVGNADSPQTGCIRFKYTPNYNGANTIEQQIFTITKSSTNGDNRIFIRQRAGGVGGAYLNLHIYDQTGALIKEALIGFFVAVQGQEYEMEVNYDLTNGVTRFFLDGVQSGATITETGTRSNDINLLRIGTMSTRVSNFKIDDFQVFSTVQHTANYTPVAIPETSYADDSPTIYKTLGDGVANIEEFIAFAETLGSANQGSVRYQLSDDGVDWLYWNGSIWTTAGISDYNTYSECEAHMLDFDATADKIYVKTFLISDGSQKVELDENQVGYIINTAPLVYAGLNKTAIYNIAMAPFSDCLFSDAEGNIVKAEWKEEGGAYVEIPQGAYSTLLDAVQAFSYTPTYSGNKNIYLKITDSYDAYTEDILIINVNRVNITINIKDINGNNLPNVTFDAGDGTGSSVKNSSFTLTGYIGTFTALLSKTFFDNLSEAYTLTIASTSLSFIMTRAERIDELKINIDAPVNYTLGDSFNLDCVIDTDLTDYKIRCEISDNSLNEVKLATANSGGSNSEIEVYNASTGQFIIQVAKDLTTDFNKKSTIEIEIENSDGEVRTIWKKDIEFQTENIDWTDPTA